ncbi:MAG: EAL domain-containing protein [Actinomycetota bacterium]
MTDTQHAIEPVPARGGLRRLRLGDLDTAASAGERLPLTWADFRQAVETEIRRARLDDHTLAVATVTLRRTPGRRHWPPPAVLDRIRSVGDAIQITIGPDDQLVLLIPSIRRRPDAEALIHHLARVLDEPLTDVGIDHHLAPRIGAALLDTAPAGALLHIAPAGARLDTARLDTAPAGARLGTAPADGDDPEGAATDGPDHLVDLLLDGARLANERCDHRHPAMLFHPYHRLRRERRAQLSGELRQAVLAGTIGAAIQPAFDLRTGSLVAVEAFARWQRPGGGPIPPLEFVPLAAELGLDHLLTTQVLSRAMELLARTADQQPPGRRPDGPVTLWLNVTPDELLHHDFESLIRSVVDEHPAVRPGIELSPSPPAEHGEVHDTLRRLVDAGARAAIGDFGIGNANLTVVPHLPFDSVKIDRALVRRIAGPTDPAGVVDHLAGLAHRLDLEVTAQGIETRDQLRLVASAGCQLGQGFSFAPPTSDPATIARWFHR